MNSEFTKEYIRSSVNTFKNNEYRISDGLECSHIRTSYMEKMKDSVSLQSRSPTFEALVSNVSEYIKNKNFSPIPDDCLAIHLRLGDFVFLKKKSEYIALLESVKKKIYENPSLRSIIVITAFNFDKNFPFNYDENKLETSVDILHAFIQGLPLPVQLQSSTPDEDFCKLATAQHLCISFGGYAKLAARVKNALANKTQAH
jgi:hypothetical protein